jgi:hypothetical protein
MSTTTERPLETGWLPDTPVDDNLLRQFLANQVELNELMAGVHGGRTQRHEGVALADCGVPVAYYNQAILTRPVMDAGDPVLDEIEAFFGDGRTPHTMLSVWPTADLTARGWTRYGHPMFVARGAAPVPDEPAPQGVETGVVGTEVGLLAAERVAVEGYPLPVAADSIGSILPTGLLGTALTIRLGFVDGEPVTTAASHVAHGVTNLCLAATLPAARRRGVWRRLVWDRVGDRPDLPAVAFTSDDSRPGFVHLGFLPIARFTLWGR